MITAAPSRVMACLVALLAGCPVLVNIVATYISDGESFMITTASSILVVLGMISVVVMRGVTLRLNGPFGVFAIVAAIFWIQFFILALSFPSQNSESLMQMLPAYAVLWIVVPLTCVMLTRHVFDTRQVFSAALVLMALYVFLTALRFALGLGKYHAGRWAPGESLEAIRAGRYTATAVFVFVVTLAMPEAVRWQRILATLSLGPACFLLISANARGPWLALCCGFLLTAPGIIKMLVHRINQDVRIGVMAVLFGVAILIGIGSMLGSVESNFARLFDTSQDGGSAAGRSALLYDYLALFTFQPSGWLTGFGYGHELFYPHNLFVEIVSVGGLPMLCLFLFLIGLVFSRGLGPAWGGDGLSVVFFGLLIIGLGGAQFSGSLANELMPWLTAPLVLMRAEELTLIQVDEDPTTEGAS